MSLSQAVISLLDILLERYGCDWSRRDIQRMELVIMQQLEFHLSRPTVLDFITSVRKMLKNTDHHWLLYSYKGFTDVLGLI